MRCADVALFKMVKFPSTWSNFRRRKFQKFDFRISEKWLPPFILGYPRPPTAQPGHRQKTMKTGRDYTSKLPNNGCINKRPQWETCTHRLLDFLPSGV